MAQTKVTIQIATIYVQDGTVRSTPVIVKQELDPRVLELEVKYAERAIQNLCPQYTKRELDIEGAIARGISNFVVTQIVTDGRRLKRGFFTRSKVVETVETFADFYEGLPAASIKYCV